MLELDSKLSLLVLVVLEEEFLGIFLGVDSKLLVVLMILEEELLGIYLRVESKLLLS